MTIVLDVSFSDPPSSSDEISHKKVRNKNKNNENSSRAIKVAKVKHKVNTLFFFIFFFCFIKKVELITIESCETWITVTFFQLPRNAPIEQQWVGKNYAPEFLFYRDAERL